VASTTDGRYFLRVVDQSKPVTGDDVMRLASERSALPWETQITLHIPRVKADAAKRDKLLLALRASDRVKASVKEKTDDELLDHYQLAQGTYLTHLGILCLGLQRHRAQLTTSPVIQFLKYDEQGQKVNKLVWDDHTQSPMEVIEAVWLEVPDFRERYELPDGLYRQSVPAFDEVVVRELLVNALVHRPYTQRGDIFLNLHPDRLEIVNPGPLPLGVTPQNVLHTTVRRNEHLARLFHDLKLMEREGSGFVSFPRNFVCQG
jgi:ATP-dependent DNA helicase RecG